MVAASHGCATATQPHSNLVERDHDEGELANLCAREGIACIPYCPSRRASSGKYGLGGQLSDLCRMTTLTLPAPEPEQLGSTATPAP